MGQLNTTAVLTDAILKQNDKGMAFQLWVANNGTRTEVTRTQYDAPLDAAIEAKFANGQQENLRMRVASVMHYENYPVSALSYQSANHYSYDVHGNVMEVIQDVPVMAPGGLQDISTQYEYELISGNMKKVSYQKEKIDQLTHQYTYDDLNRLVDVYSSIDDIHYHREASYSYFDYGPLARKEIGSARVQGQDFTYTLNGWLKGMNSNTLDKTKDPGKDGTVYPSGVFAARNERVAKDVVGFSLGYYGGDYSPIGGNPAEAAYAGTAFGNGADDLFNGNIRHMVTAIEGLAIQGYAYRYDQLQRIKQMQVYRASDVQSLFAWTNSSATDEYKTTFSYDRNGNLTTLNRNGIGAELDMDRFVYNYHMIGGEPSNRLDYVTDNGTDYASYEDIKSGQTSGNYTYNKIGELVSDVSESMILHWRTGDHKLSKIERTDQDSPQIEFFYTAFGQRAMKVEKPRVSGVIQSASNWKYTYYSYDANGQVMAVYTGNFQGSSEQVKLSEHYLYGAERLGVIKSGKVVFDNGVVAFNHKENESIHNDLRGHKRYELTSHTNNILAVINDRKIYNTTDDIYEPVIIAWADYYTFGMQMPGRYGAVTSETYRYGFQGMEMDSESLGKGNSYTTEFRQYDPRLGRWKSLDPLMSQFPDISPYIGFDNNPVVFTDNDGDCPWCALFDYAWQVGNNLVKGKSMYDAFIGDVDFVSVAVSGIPGGKGVMKMIKLAGEAYSHVTDNTINDGIRMKSKEAIITSVVSSYTSKRIVKSLKKMSSNKTYSKIQKMHWKYVKKSNNQNAKLKKRPNHQGALQKREVFNAKIESLRKQEVVSKTMNKTFGKFTANQWGQVKTNADKIIKVGVEAMSNSTPNDTNKFDDMENEQLRYDKKYNDHGPAKGEIYQDGVFKRDQLWNGRQYNYDNDGILLDIDVYENGNATSKGTIETTTNNEKLD